MTKFDAADNILTTIVVVPYRKEWRKWAKKN